MTFPLITIEAAPSNPALLAPACRRHVGNGLIRDAVDAAHIHGYALPASTDEHPLARRTTRGRKHRARRFRNKVVHQSNPSDDPLTLRLVTRYLCTYLDQLKRNW